MHGLGKKHLHIQELNPGLIGARQGDLPLNLPLLFVFIQVSEVRLFGEEEDIQQDLYLAVCSWPTDRSKVLVYGW